MVEQGIGPEWPDEDVIRRVSLLTSVAIADGDESKRSIALQWHSSLEKRVLSLQHAARLDYSWANALAGARYGTQWEWKQPTLAREIYLLRRAVRNPGFIELQPSMQCEILNNLGNRLSVSGRVIEALEMWRRALVVMPSFGMSQWNRARELVLYAGALSDPGKQALLFWVAHREASSALSGTAFYSTPEDKRRAHHALELKHSLEESFNVQAMNAVDPLSWPDSATTLEERDYQLWCLDNSLYLNEANDVGPVPVASADTLSLGEHAIEVASVEILEAFFDQLKQEYVSARWALYEGITSASPHFSDKDVVLHDTAHKPALSRSVERTKAAYRAAYSIFDKVSLFLWSYMQIPIPERSVTFRTIWWKEKDVVRPEFDPQYNWAFCALFWMAYDFSEKETDEVAEPDARNLSAVRNHLEHKYLRVTRNEARSPRRPILRIPYPDLTSKAKLDICFGRQEQPSSTCLSGLGSKRRGGQDSAHKM